MSVYLTRVNEFSKRRFTVASRKSERVMPARKSSRPGGQLIDHAVAQHSDPPHFHFHHVAGNQVPRRIEARPGARGRSGTDDVPGLERAEARDVGNKEWNRE